MFTDITFPCPKIDGRNWTHREISYSPKAMREHRAIIKILTDMPSEVEPEFAKQTDGVIADLRQLSDVDISETAFYITFSRAELAIPHLRRIVDCQGLFAPPPGFGKVPFHAVSTKALDSFNEAGRILGHEPFMGVEVHSQICQAVELTKNIKGDFVEIGVFSGSSALTALLHMRNIGVRRRCWLLDTYSGFTYPAAKASADMIWSGTHLMDETKTIDRITNLVKPAGQDVHVVATEICGGELPPEINSIALANIDVDLYEAVLAALEKLAPLMAMRGIMIVEDPTSLPGLYGAYLAMTEFLETETGRKFMAVRTTTQYFVIRVQH